MNPKIKMKKIIPPAENSKFYQAVYSCALQGPSALFPQLAILLMSYIFPPKS